MFIEHKKIKNRLQQKGIFLLGSLFLCSQAYAVPSMAAKNLNIAAEAYKNSDVAFLKELHDLGNPYATHMLVRCFKHGDPCGISKDATSAQKYEAKYNLSDVMTQLYSLELRNEVQATNWIANYLSEDSVESSKTEAFSKFKANAEAGDAYAMYRLATYYLYGYSPVNKDIKLASKWLTQAANAGHLKSMEMLATMYKKGNELPHDNDKAQQWLAKSAATRKSAQEKFNNTRGFFQTTKKNVVIKTFFGTNRNLKKTDNVKNKFGHQLSSLYYGSINVSIPEDHRVSKIESPYLWFQENPNKHVMFPDNALKIMGYQEFYTKLSAQMQASKNKKALVFIHGFNTSFEDAAKRTAQMTYDLQFDGVPVFYSWPARKTIIPSYSNYRTNEVSIKSSLPKVTSFLEGVLKKTQADEVYLIAHSMGNRALTTAMVDLLKKEPKLGKKIKEVILAAPDVDNKVFKTKIAPVFYKNLKKPVTLYSSTNDLALSISSKVNGTERLGDASNAEKIPGVENIDVSNIDSSFIGHSYYGENESVVSDIVCLIHKNKRAKQRTYLDNKPVKFGMQWLFNGIKMFAYRANSNKDYC